MASRVVPTAGDRVPPLRRLQGPRTYNRLQRGRHAARESDLSSRVAPLSEAEAQAKAEAGGGGRGVGWALRREACWLSQSHLGVVVCTCGKFDCGCRLGALRTPSPAAPRRAPRPRPLLFLSRGLEASLWQVEKTGEGVYSFPPNALSFWAWPAQVEHVPGFANSPPGKERREEGRSGLND